MRTKIKLIAAVIGMLCMLGALAQTGTGYLSKRDNTSAKSSVVVFPGAATRQIVLKSVDVTGDNADTVLKLFGGVTRTTVTTNRAGSETVIGVASTNGFTDADMVIIQRASGTHTLHSLTTRNASSLTLGATIGTAVVVGDAVWCATHVATNTVASATVRKSGDALFATQLRAPLALNLVTSAGSACRINDATVLYYKPE